MTKLPTNLFNITYKDYNETIPNKKYIIMYNARTSNPFIKGENETRANNFHTLLKKVVGKIKSYRPEKVTADFFTSEQNLENLLKLHKKFVQPLIPSYSAYEIKYKKNEEFKIPSLQTLYDPFKQEFTEGLVVDIEVKI